MLKKIALAAVLAMSVMAAPAFAQETTTAAAPAAPAAAATGALTVDSQIPDLLANAGTHAVLAANLPPELMSNPQLATAPISLRGLQQYVPSLTDDKLATIATQLAAAQAAH